MTKASFLFVAAAFLQVIAAVDFEGAKEQACFPIKNTVRVDTDWVRDTCIKPKKLIFLLRK